MSKDKRLKYEAPDFLSKIFSQDQYERWLRRKAAAHIKRDRNRGNVVSSNKEYLVAIHKAVILSGGVDYYTGEPLEWHLLSQWDNTLSKKWGRTYKSRFALLPSVDHVGDGISNANFVICAWRTNGSKNDMPYEEFLSFCRKVVAYSDGQTTKIPSPASASPKATADRGE